MYKIKLTDPFGNVGTIVPVVASILILGFSFSVVGVGSAEASDIQAYAIESESPFPGNQDWTGALGNDFDVYDPITITSLGVFDDNADGIAGTLRVYIYDLSDTSDPLASQTISGSVDLLMGQFRFKDITPLTLDPGRYSVVAYGFGPNDQNANEEVSDIPLVTNDGGGSIVFVDSRFDLDDPITTFPLSTTLGFFACSGRPQACFGAGSFKYRTSEVNIGIDIKPGSDLNPINMCSSGVIPVAIFGSDTFNVVDVDASTLRLGDGTPGGSAVKMVGRARKKLCNTEDVDLDGHDDLVCMFVTIDLNLAEGATEAMVLGTNTSTGDFTATDSVEITKFCE